mmetsp:Transcript_14265/g.38686  ORF Transcript_14265/g.38686 Transcript_14265/m.38686 type:complete len:209 (+) Transcript_14265:1506-2132(+)
MEVSMSTYSTTTLNKGRGNWCSWGVLAHSVCSSLSLSYRSLSMSTWTAVRGKPSTRTPQSVDLQLLANRASSKMSPTSMSGIISPFSMIARASGCDISSEDREMLVSRPLVFRMCTVLAPFPEPGAPLRNTTSLGTRTFLSLYLSSKRLQHASKMHWLSMRISVASEALLLLAFFLSRGTTLSCCVCSKGPEGWHNTPLPLLCKLRHC